MAQRDGQPTHSEATEGCHSRRCLSLEMSAVRQRMRRGRPGRRISIGIGHRRRILCVCRGRRGWRGRWRCGDGNCDSRSASGRSCGRYGCCRRRSRGCCSRCVCGVGLPIAQDGPRGRRRRSALRPAQRGGDGLARQARADALGTAWWLQGMCCTDRNGRFHLNRGMRSSRSCGGGARERGCHLAVSAIDLLGGPVTGGEVRRKRRSLAARGRIGCVGSRGVCRGDHDDRGR